MLPLIDQTSKRASELKGDVVTVFYKPGCFKARCWQNFVENTKECFSTPSSVRVLGFINRLLGFDNNNRNSKRSCYALVTFSQTE